GRVVGVGMMAEFSDFLKKYQVLGLAVAFIIGAAATKLVSAMVNDVVMPIIAVLVPGGEWRAATLDIGPVKFLLGDFVGAVIDFLIIALVVFMIVKMIMKEDATAKR
ncbi:MAG: MscL family protein, partial [Candidatus Micrarchaeota archaeon]